MMGPYADQNPQDDARAQADMAERLKKAREQYQRAKDLDRDDEEKANEDLLFYVGGENQWPEEAVRERKRLGRPLYTANKFPATVAQVTGEVQANPPAITCAPADAAASPEKAKVFDGLIRYIERRSQAQLHYCEALESAVVCGKGHLRVLPVYPNDTSLDPELRIRAITNVFSVKWDPAAQEFDKSDANWCFVYSEHDEKSFKETYPDIGSGSWDTAQAAFRKVDGWRSFSSGKIAAVEQWVVKKTPFKRWRVVHRRPGWQGPMMILPTNQAVELDGDLGADTIDGIPSQQFLEMLGKEGWDVTASREAYKRQVCMYLWVGDTQIAGPIEWLGTRIPIWTVPGRRTHIGSQTIHSGIIRHSKDPQRGINYSRAADLELISQAPKSPIMVAEDQIEGHEDTWALAQRQPVPYLPYNHVQGLAAPQERSGPSTNPGPQSFAQASNQDLQDTTGVHDASLGKKSNETSGVAIAERDAQTDTGTFVFIFHLRLIVESIGRELVAAAPNYYSQQEQILILGEDDALAVMAAADVDFSGKYEVTVKTGPAYQTLRDKAADLIVETMKIAPEPAIPILFESLFELTDIPNGDKIAQRIQQAFMMAGLVPPPPGAMPGMPPGMMQPSGPGGPMPPPSPGPLPPNVVPMPQRGAPAMAPDPLAGVDLPVPPLRAPAAQTRVGPPRLAMPPGM